MKKKKKKKKFAVQLVNKDAKKKLLKINNFYRI